MQPGFYEQEFLSHACILYREDATETISGCEDVQRPDCFDSISLNRVYVDIKQVIFAVKPVSPDSSAHSFLRHLYVFVGWHFANIEPLVQLNSLTTNSFAAEHSGW